MGEHAGPVGEGEHVMRSFRRLPPLLRVASLLGLLFYLTTLALLTDSCIMFLSSFPHAYQDSSPMFIIALNLLWLGSACVFAVNGYSTRFHRSDRGPFPLDSWQSQVRAIALLSALPLCGIVLALVIPPTSLAFVVVFPISLLAAVVVIAAQIVGVASSGPMRTPRA
jgi:hypothetical protein